MDMKDQRCRQNNKHRRAKRLYRLERECSKSLARETRCVKVESDDELSSSSSSSIPMHCRRMKGAHVTDHVSDFDGNIAPQGFILVPPTETVATSFYEPQDRKARIDRPSKTARRVKIKTRLALKRRL
eukprot:Blabericola_migrator_1__9283@NODE_499_length_8005_cov_262_271857_g382_i0_p7_GENE_NODE_499_length_8005_cov_262_271857_g382_i0NODE_499_length_8005_cov_262_271857_g382_i0_p7_ORF_typecomplete_len128_score18_10_NODE_499_length_8005_cov_262_271857_g382_i018192202